MILDDIVIENFGVYAGHQQAILTPEPGRPIILFGGMNGGGKTTLPDAIKLTLYGPKARLSNRGRQGYRDYLRAAIHRHADPGVGAGVTLRFRRLIEGETHSFVLQRRWRVGSKGIEESLQVLHDGVSDDLLSEHWDEAVTTFLPVGIAHLFFFDGEQIADLADGGHAAEIIGTALNTLLGLDLLERLTADLKAFERKQRGETLDDASLAALAESEAEVAHLDQAIEQIAMAEGMLIKEAKGLAEEVDRQREAFEAAGGNLYQGRNALRITHEGLLKEKAQCEDALRDLIAGPLPLAPVDDLLAEIEAQACHEIGIRHAKVLAEALEERDRAVLAALDDEAVGEDTLSKIRRILSADRTERTGLAHQSLLFDADDRLAAQVAYLRATRIPSAERAANQLTQRLEQLEERLARTEAQLARIPSEDSIQVTQNALDVAEQNHHAKLHQLDRLREQRALLQREYAEAGARLERLSIANLEARIEADDQARILTHSARVRRTLQALHHQAVARHADNIQALMLESFGKLLGKTDLVGSLSIDPRSFEPNLRDPNGCCLPFERLSAGERQLLATALLWGLARASGRPIPAIIDTPLGRLDSSHRRNLVERYFPAASHQVLLLSTDEEIIGHYHQALDPYISRRYLLAYDCEAHATAIRAGYFATDETTSRPYPHQLQRERNPDQAEEADRDRTLEPALQIGTL
ncbi:DNA sulfur modification protein DndD [Candidatus Thiosymbion oneisti]|uniref:DNA sulfur modification protein DndD n=1 Tax=Candidatus Thiosymbion oneisti TaxID=589554 RepID=UPI000B0AA5FC|nr:DNA sulfur modification protein DndD [Candidatus Thiosymbion oneisti]